MIRDLQCGDSTSVDSIDDRVVTMLERRFRCKLDPEFLAHMALYHGAIPKIATFRAGGKERRIGQFLSLLDDESDLRPPLQPYFEDQETDERVVNSISYLIDGEHATSRALFSGLLPFASMAVEMCLDRAYVDLLCLDYRETEKQPPIVLWVAEGANAAYLEWDELPWDQQFGEDDTFLNVSWNGFLLPVSGSFTEFIESID